MGLRCIDKFSYLHFGSGIIAKFLNISIIDWFIINLLFEIIENSEYGIEFINKYFKFWPGGKPYSDSLLNSICDIIFSLLGWISAYYIILISDKRDLYKSDSRVLRVAS